MSSFQDMCFLFTITLRQKPKGVTCSRRRTGHVSVELQDGELSCSTPSTRNSFGLLYQDYCERHLVSYL